MCNAFAQLGVRVTLFAKRSCRDESILLQELQRLYGVELKDVRIVSFFSTAGRGDNMRIAFLALRELWRGRQSGLVVSRNLYAAFVLAVLLGRRLVFETHQLESGLRKRMQRAIMTRSRVSTVVISRMLVDCLTEHHGVGPRHPVILHDAAPEGISPIPPGQRRSVMGRIVPAAAPDWRAICGYFGHLYPGRGIEIIEAMAAERKEVLFLVFGGNETDVEARRKANGHRNLVYVGHVPHQVAREAMTAADVLLMPYQRSVSIGAAGHDTARWMSPMKMFEYLASGVPTISSDLPVLREVLRDGENCLLVKPDDPRSWLAALDRLLADMPLAERLGATGHFDYQSHHTWRRRADALLAATIGSR